MLQFQEEAFFYIARPQEFPSYTVLISRNGMHIWLYFLFGDNFRRSKKVLLYYSLQPYRNDFIIEALMDIEKTQKRLTFWLRFSSLKKKFASFCCVLHSYSILLSN